MLEPTLVEKARREGAKTNMLFAEYLKSPSNTRLALEIAKVNESLYITDVLSSVPAQAEKA
jgi:ribosomal protein L18E